MIFWTLIISVGYQAIRTEDILPEMVQEVDVLPWKGNWQYRVAHLDDLDLISKTF